MYGTVFLTALFAVFFLWQIARGLLDRAREVALSEYTESLYEEVNTDSYSVWIRNNWWQVPFLEELSTL